MDNSENIKLDFKVQDMDTLINKLQEIQNLVSDLGFNHIYNTYNGCSFNYAANGSADATYDVK